MRWGAQPWHHHLGVVDRYLLGCLVLTTVVVGMVLALAMSLLRSGFDPARHPMAAARLDSAEC